MSSGGFYAERRGAARAGAAERARETPGGLLQTAFYSLPPCSASVGVTSAPRSSDASSWGT